jgi:hypothetical protein
LLPAWDDLKLSLSAAAWNSVSVGATFAFKSRTNFSTNFVRGLSKKFRDLNAVTMQLNPGKSSKIKKRQSGI